MNDPCLFAAQHSEQTGGEPYSDPGPDGLLFSILQLGQIHFEHVWHGGRLWQSQNLYQGNFVAFTGN